MASIPGSLGVNIDSPGSNKSADFLSSVSNGRFSRSQFQKLIKLCAPLAKADQKTFLEATIFKNHEFISIIPSEGSTEQRAHTAAAAIQPETKIDIPSPLQVLENDTAGKYRNDFNYMLTAIALDVKALEYLPEERRTDDQSLIQILEANPETIERVIGWISQHSELSEIICYAIVKQIQSACEKFPVDKKVISKQLVGLIKLVKAAQLRFNVGNVRELVVRKLGLSPNLVLPIIAVSPEAAMVMSSDLCSVDFIEKALACNYGIVRYAKWSFCSALMDLKKSQYISAENDKDRVQRLSEFIELYKIVSQRDEFSDCKAVLKECLDEVLNATIAANNKVELWESLVDEDVSFFTEAPDAVRQDRELIKGLLGDFPEIIEGIHPSLLQDPEAVIEFGAIEFSIIGKFTGEVTPEFYKPASVINKRAVVSLISSKTCCIRLYLDNISIINRLLRECPEVIADVDSTLLKDDDFVECAMKINPLVVTHIRLDNLSPRMSAWVKRERARGQEVEAAAGSPVSDSDI